MGQNLSSLEVVDISLDVISPTDRNADFILATIWGSVFYIIAMIFTTCKLLNRWGGPNGDKRINICSVLGALILSIAWPFVLIFVRS